MVNPTPTNTARKDIASGSRSIHTSVSSDRQFHRSSIQDDVIMNLSSAYENQRAQQVHEWERVQAKRLQRAV
jgi:hypothetical protein